MKKRQARLELRDTARNYFDNEIIRFKHWRETTEEYKNTELLQDINWQPFIDHPKQKSQLQSTLLTQGRHNTQFTPSNCLAQTHRNSTFSNHTTTLNIKRSSSTPDLLSLK